MRNRLDCLVFAATVLHMPLLHAAPWHLLEVKDTTGLFFFDAQSVVRKGDTVTVWIRQAMDPARPDGGATALIAAHDVFDCKENSIRTLQADMFARDGTLLHSDRRDKPAFYPEADTPGAHFVKVACLPDFPALAHPDLYTAVPAGDMNAYAARFFADHAKGQPTPASKSP